MGRTKDYPNGAKHVKGIAYDDKRECYYVTVSCGKNSEGKSTKITRTSPTLAGAKEIQKQLKKDLQEGKLTPVERDTVIERVRQFIDYKALSLEETTIYGYNSIYNNHFVPYFKKKRIQDVTVQDIKAYITYQSKKGKLSNNSIRKHTDLLKQVFKEAYKERVIRENPFLLMDDIKTENKEKECFNTQEVTELLTSVAGTQLETPVYLAVYLGLRREEVLGLRWRDVDFEKRVVHITNVKTKAGDAVVEKAPKTKKSERTLKFDDTVYDVLLRQKEKKPVNRDMMKRALPKSEYVVTMDDGKPFSVNYLSACFSNHLEKHGFKKVTFHGLRHSFASIAYNAGTPLQEISDSLGHSTPSTTTKVYTHEFTREKSVATDAVANSIEQAKCQ